MGKGAREMGNHCDELGANGWYDEGGWWEKEKGET